MWACGPQEKRKRGTPSCSRQGTSSPAPLITVAIVGHTGAGKSSLARLVARFYEFQGGQLLIDGRDIRTFDLQSYHRQLGIVPQIPFLFSGTIADNIRYALPEATDEQIAMVVQHIGGGDWLEGLPDGLNTLVGEAGRSLSLGQRQLVVIHVRVCRAK